MRRAAGRAARYAPPMSASDAVERFLATGEHDPRFPGFAGDIVARRREATVLLKDVLRRVVGWRAGRARSAARLPPDAAAQVRARVEPLVRGVLGAEGAPLVEPLVARVVVVTPAAFGALVEDVPLRTAWDLANLLLDDLGAPPLADDAPSLDGLCAAGRAWVAPSALARAFPDVVAHEAAHLLHHVRRADLGLPGAGVLLAIPPRRRETFAYACEAWAAIARGDATLARARAVLADTHHSDGRVDRHALHALLTRASEGGGWAVIRAWGEGRRG